MKQVKDVVNHAKHIFDQLVKLESFDFINLSSYERSNGIYRIGINYCVDGMVKTKDHTTELVVRTCVIELTLEDLRLHRLYHD